MNILKLIAGGICAAAVVPYRVRITDANEGEKTGPKNLSVESLTYRVDVTVQRDDNGHVIEGRDVSVTFPADGIKKIVSFVKEKTAVLFDNVEFRKNGDGEEEVTDDDPEEEITIEVIPEEYLAGEAAAKKRAPKKKPAKEENA